MAGSEAGTEEVPPVDIEAVARSAVVEPSEKAPLEVVEHGVVEENPASCTVLLPRAVVGRVMATAVLIGSELNASLLVVAMPDMLVVLAAEAKDELVLDSFTVDEVLVTLTVLSEVVDELSTTGAKVIEVLAWVDVLTGLAEVDPELNGEILTVEVDIVVDTLVVEGEGLAEVVVVRITVEVKLEGAPETLTLDVDVVVPTLLDVIEFEGLPAVGAVVHVPVAEVELVLEDLALYVELEFKALVSLVVNEVELDCRAGEGDAMIGNLPAGEVDVVFTRVADEVLMDVLPAAEVDVVVDILAEVGSEAADPTTAVDRVVSALVAKRVVNLVVDDASDEEAVVFKRVVSKTGADCVVDVADRVVNIVLLVEEAVEEDVDVRLVDELATDRVDNIVAVDRVVEEFDADRVVSEFAVDREVDFGVEKVVEVADIRVVSGLPTSRTGDVAENMLLGELELLVVDRGVDVVVDLIGVVVFLAADTVADLVIDDAVVINELDLMEVLVVLLVAGPIELVMGAFAEVDSLLVDVVDFAVPDKLVGFVDCVVDLVAVTGIVLFVD